MRRPSRLDEHLPWQLLVANMLAALALFGGGDSGPRARLAVPGAVVYVLSTLLGTFAGVGAVLRASRAGPLQRAQRRRALGEGATAIVLALLAFANVYYVGSARDPGAFSEPLSAVDAVYFAVGNLTTASLQDISPLAGWARAVVATQMLLDLLLAGTVVAGVLTIIQSSTGQQEPRRSRTASRAHAEPPTSVPPPVAAGAASRRLARTPGRVRRRLAGRPPRR